MIEAGAERNLCHVSYSRPGCEGSDRLAGRLIIDCARDVEAIVDQLGLENGFVIGESGGGSYALAHAALKVEWVRGVAVIGGLAPLDARGLDWFEGMAPGNREEYIAMMNGDAAGRELLEAVIKKIKAARDIRQVNEAFGYPWAEVDVLSPEKEGLKDEVMDTCRRIVASGPLGWLDDDMAALGDWGFGLDEVKTPVAVWHGEDDLAVPVAHGRWVADYLPSARFHLLSGQGYSSLLDSYGEILDDLVEAGL